MLRVAHRRDCDWQRRRVLALGSMRRAVAAAARRRDRAAPRGARRRHRIDDVLRRHTDDARASRDDPSISAMLTVNSPFRLMNSLVPSSGSTSQYLDPRTAASQSPARFDSSDSTGISGVSACSASQINVCDARSACVSGDASSFVDHVEVRCVDFEDRTSGVVDDFGTSASMRRLRSVDVGHALSRAVVDDWLSDRQRR